MQRDGLESLQVGAQLVEGLVEVLVVGHRVDAVEAGHVVGVVAAGRQGHLTAQAVACEGGHGDAVGVHEAEDVVGVALPRHVGVAIRVAEVPGVQDPDVALAGDLVGGVGEELEPVLGLVEGLGDEDEVGTVLHRRLDVDASELDFVFCPETGSCIGGKSTASDVRDGRKCGSVDNLRE